VYAAGSEDMDTLTFNTPILLRHLTFSEAKKQPILEVDLKKALDGLDMTMSQVFEPMFLAVAFTDDLFSSSLNCAYCSVAITSNQ
jgi:hypothetical protein